ncbi:MAG: hypothetical protein ABSC19_08535 [Syntrophorhabdales bacterium]
MIDPGDAPPDHDHGGPPGTTGGHAHGHPDPEPSVYSHSLSARLDRTITGKELIARVTDCVNDLNLWAREHGVLVGHIKVFVEGEETLKVWIASTGREVNLNISAGCRGTRVGAFTLDMTAIMLGTDSQSLRAAVLETVNKRIHIDLGIGR